MKKIDVSFAIDPVRQPFMARSVSHLQEAFQEPIDAICQFLSRKSPGGVTVLFGCVDSGVAPAVNITAGAVYYSGEVYLVAAAAFTPTGANVAVANIVTTYQAGDPALFSDNSSHNVHQIRRVVISDAAAGSGIADFSDFKRVSLTTSELVGDRDDTLGYTYGAAESTAYTLPATTKTGKAKVDFNFEIIPSSGAATPYVLKFRVKRNGSTVKTTEHNVLADGARWLLTVSFYDAAHTAGDIFTLTVEPSIVASGDIDVIDGTVQVFE